MNLSDFYNSWLADTGIDRGKNDAVSFMRRYMIPQASQDYLGQAQRWNAGQGGRLDTLQGYMDQLGSMPSNSAYIRSRVPQFRQNVNDQVQAGRNVARSAGVGNRMAGANSYARGLMGDAIQQGEGQASRFRRMGLGSGAQAGAMLNAQNQARAMGGQARLGAMSPMAQAQAAAQAAQGYGMASQAMGQEQQFLQNMDMGELQKFMNILQSFKGITDMQRPDMSQIANLSQLLSQWEGTKASTKKQGTNWGGLLGGLANMAGGGLFKGLFGGGGGSGGSQQNPMMLNYSNNYG